MASILRDLFRAFSLNPTFVCHYQVHIWDFDADADVGFAIPCVTFKGAMRKGANLSRYHAQSSGSHHKFLVCRDGTPVDGGGCRPEVVTKFVKY